MSDLVDSDENLMLRFAAGEVRAFEILYRRYELKLWRFICRSVGNRATADELLQDVWFSIVQAAPRYQPVARFTTWAFTLAHNRLIDRHRATKPLRSVDAANDDCDHWVAQLATDATSDPARQAESAQQLAVLLSALGQLPSEQRAAFLLQAEGDLSVEEIAEATGVSFETAKSRLRYARTRLKQVLQEMA
ncbi:MAG: sigma-70 family RNA polymerase sigma factor [Steroidobacteraceae bacterium]|jgi:RNA polymerase sigma-70 factor (ECF subfamily)